MGEEGSIRHKIAKNKDARPGEEDVVPFILKMVGVFREVLVREIVDWNVRCECRC